MKIGCHPAARAIRLSIRMTQLVGGSEPTKPTPPTRREEKGDLPFRISVWAMIFVLLVRSPANLVVLGWFTETYRDTSASSEVSHRLHEVAFGLFFSIALVGAISLLLRPRRNPAGLAQLAITLIILAVVVTWTLGIDYWLFLFLVPLAGILWFHGPVGPWREGPIQLWAVFLLAFAMPAFLGVITSNAFKAVRSAQNHTTHWSVMAAFYIVLLLLGLLVAFRVRGYRLAGWSLGLASIVFGSAAMSFPYDASSHRTDFAVFLVIWGLAWSIGTAVLGRAGERTQTRKVLVAVASLAIVPFVLVISVILVPALDAPPNVPHRPNPNVPDMTATDVERTTCMECHASGVAGAPLIPHESSRTCGNEEPCWGGRSDCAGCHRIDPLLGGPTEQVFAGLPEPAVHLLAHSAVGVQSLSPSEIEALQNLRIDR